MKRIISILFAVALVLGVSLVAATPVAAQGPEDVLDHFKVYEAFDWFGPVDEPVYLEDQFGDLDAIVMEAMYFANPVMKNGEDILHMENHLTLYYLEHSEPFQPLTVEVNNQFGLQELEVVDAPYLLAVPTDKQFMGTPVDLDHFLLYPVTGASIGVSVALSDQWGLDPSVLVLEPVFLGNPVQKTDGGGVTRILHPDAHLVFYVIEGASGGPPMVFTTNQFFFGDLLDVYGAYFLAVPSEKSLPPVAVGWETYTIEKVRVLLPWIVLVAAILAGAGLLVVRRRRAEG